MTETNYSAPNQTIVEYVNNSAPVVEAPAPTEAPVEEAAPVEETAPVEAAPETAPEPEEDPKFASRFAALTKKEREIIQRERAFKEQQAKLQAYEKAMQKAKENPLEYLQAAGLTLEEALSQIINEGKEPTEQDRLNSIEQKIKDYEEHQKQLQLRAQEYRKQQELAAIHNDIKAFVDQNEEQYELIKAYNNIDLVWSVIERTYLETGGKVHLTTEQACQAVEEQLLSEKMEELELARKLKKLQAKLAPEVSTESKQQPVSKTVSPTLTNSGGTVSTSPPRKFKTREESLADAARLLKWKD